MVLKGVLEGVLEGYWWGTAGVLEGVLEEVLEEVLEGYWSCTGGSTGGSTGGGELLLMAPVHPLKQSPTHLFNSVTVNESIFSQVKGREGVRSPAKHNTS